MSFRKIVQILVLVAVLIVPVQLVAAQAEEAESSTTAREDRNSARELREQQKLEKQTERDINKEERANNISVKCTVITRKFENIAGKVDGELARRSIQFDAIVDRIERLIIRIELAEIDATGLKDLLSTYKEEVQTVIDIANEYQVLANDIASQSCDDETNYEDLLLSVDDAQDARAAARVGMLEAKSLLQVEVKNELQVIKDQLVESDDTSEAEPEESEEV